MLFDLRIRRKGVPLHLLSGSLEEFLSKQSVCKRRQKLQGCNCRLMQTQLSQSGSLPSAHFLRLALRKAERERMRETTAQKAPLCLRCYLITRKHTCTPVHP